MPRRSYDHYCPISRALDVVGERWSLLIVRELLAGPRRYTDLFTDLPGISTDVLAARLRELERDELVVRRRSAGRSAALYELTPSGRALRPLLGALAEWGGALLSDRRPTDALRGHWFALPLELLLERALREAGHAATRPGVIEVRLDDGGFSLELGENRAHRRDEPTQATIRTDIATVTDLVLGNLELTTAVDQGRLAVVGESVLADTLRQVTGCQEHDSREEHPVVVTTA